MLIGSSEYQTLVNVATAVNETLPEWIPPDKRTSVITLLVERNMGRKIIVDSISGRPIEEIFVTDSLHNRKDSETNLRMLYALVDASEKSVALWLSPPISERGVPTGKILVAAKRRRGEREEIVEYDVTGSTFSQREFGEFAQILRQNYKQGYYLVDDLPWETLFLAIPMPKAWEKMQNGLAEEEFNAGVARWSFVIEGKPQEIYVGEIYRQSGANIRLACPKPNEIVFNQIALNVEGRALYPVKECPHCHYNVAAHEPKGIPAGWECPGCGGRFQGC